MLDPYSYTAPSRVKTLFIPLENLPRDTFFSYYEQFKENYQVRLLDVTPSKSSENTVNKFNPQGFPLGLIIYDHQLTLIDNQEIFLQDLEPFRKIFVVVGLVKYSSDLNVAKLQLHLKNLKKAFKYSIVHNIVVFGCDDPAAVVADENLFFADLKPNCYSIMCDISTNFLSALNSYAQSYQHVTLRSPGLINSNDVLKVAVSNHTSSYDVAEDPAGAEVPAIAAANPPGKKVNEKIKDSKNRGRHLKILGNFYLLAGRYPDALKEFGEALPLLKSSNDHLWLASTLENVGVALILLSFLNIPYQLPLTLHKFLQNTDKPAATGLPRNSLSRTDSATGATGSSPSRVPAARADEITLQVPEIVTQLTHKLLDLYGSTFANHEDYVPQLVYCEAIVRFVKFMTIVHCGNGFTQQVLAHLVLGTAITEKIRNDFFFTRLDIFQFSNRVFTVQLRNMSLNVQCKIYCSLASVYDDLEFYRKKSFIIRTLFVKLIPEFAREKAAPAAEDDDLLQRLAEIFNRNQQLQTQMELNNKLFENNQLLAPDNHSLMQLLDNVLLIYGVKQSPKYSANNFKKTPWFQIHTSVLRLCIDICKAIIEFEGIVVFASVLLSKYLNCLARQEQLKLLELINETQQKAKNLNITIKSHYWDPFLLRDVSLLNETEESLQPMKLKELPSGANTTIDTSEKPRSSKLVTSAVIYNPFDEGKKKDHRLQRKSRRFSGIESIATEYKKQADAIDEAPEETDESEDLEDVVEDNNEDVLLVQDEIFTVNLTVQNPFQFDIELYDIKIETNTQIALETLGTGTSHVVAAGSVAGIRVLVKPLNYGELKIVGATVTVSGRERQLYKIVYRQKYVVLEKIKTVGIELQEESDKISRRVEFKNLNLRVITPQPILSLIDLSLNNGWIMLLEGEKSSFKILLKNLSNIKINYLAFSFLDSTIEPLSKALQSKDLPVNEIYEIEYYLLKRKPLRIQKSEINKLKFIQPLDFLHLKFDIKGKRGMRDAQIILEYGNKITEDARQAQYSSYFRRISIPISVTVSPSVELAGCDLIPLFNNVNNRIGAGSDAQGAKLGLEQKNIWAYLNRRTAKISDYCLLVVDLRNSWNQKFKVTLSSSELVFPTSEELENALSEEKKSFSTDDDAFVVSETIAPGHTERFILPIKRIEFSSEYLERSIPSLRNKQFVVQESKYSKEEFKHIREAFWYRKDLLRHIKGQWIEEGSKRQGYIEMRGVRLSQRMVSVLRIEKIGIEMSLLGAVNTGLYWEVKAEEFVTIRTRIVNRSNSPLKGIIRHVPISNNNAPIDRKILYNGVLQLNVSPGVAAGQSQEFDLGMVILEKGEYEWGAIFDEQIFNDKDVDLQHTQREPLFIRAT